MLGHVVRTTHTGERCEGGKRDASEFLQLKRSAGAEMGWGGADKQRSKEGRTSQQRRNELKSKED